MDEKVILVYRLLLWRNMRIDTLNQYLAISAKDHIWVEQYAMDWNRDDNKHPVLVGG